MTLKITWKTVATVAAAAAACYLAYRVAKNEAEEREKTEAHKKEKLGDRDLFDELEQATIDNDTFNEEDRAEAFMLLDDLRAKVKCAKTIWDFDKALDDFDEMISDFTQEDRAKALACLKIYKLRKEESEDEKRRLEERERIRTQNRTEITKAEKIAKAIEKAGKMISDPNQMTAEDVIKSIKGITINY